MTEQATTDDIQGQLDDLIFALGFVLNAEQKTALSHWRAVAARNRQNPPNGAISDGHGGLMSAHIVSFV